MDTKELENEDLILIKEETPKSTNEEAQIIEGEITLQEATSALKKMKNNKSPGTDGLTVEFIKFFWTDLGVFVIRASNESFRNKELSNTQKEGIIICIPKEGRPKEWTKKLETNYMYFIKCSLQNRISLYC